eukprot:scaffold37840_cov240-Skeletonema_marinoi.AAC.2
MAKSKPRSAKKSKGNHKKKASAKSPPRNAPAPAADARASTARVEKSFVGGGSIITPYASLLCFEISQKSLEIEPKWLSHGTRQETLLGLMEYLLMCCILLKWRSLRTRLIVWRRT